MQRSDPEVLQFTSAVCSVGDVENHQEVVKFLLSNPYTPFETAFDFKFTRWMIQSRIPKTHINDYYNQKHCTPAAGDLEAGFRSSHTMCRLRHRIDPYLGQAQWQRGSYDVMERIKKRVACFYFRPLLACMQYMLQ
jgi:hypothetical protein